MKSLNDALLDVAAMLEEADIPYMVIGGMAVVVWGEPKIQAMAEVMQSSEILSRWRDLKKDS